MPNFEGPYSEMGRKYAEELTGTPHFVPCVSDLARFWDEAYRLGNKEGYKLGYENGRAEVLSRLDAGEREIE